MNERIKQIREYLGMSRAEFGEQIGVSGDVINNLERGRVEIKEDRIKLICSVFGVDEEWLRYEKGDMFHSINDDYAKISLDIDKHDPKARQAIIDYWNLSEDDKELFWKFTERFLKGADKYSNEKAFKVKIASRNGQFQEIPISESQLECIMNLPDVDDIDDLK